MGDIAVRNGRPVEVDISNLMAVVAVDRSADIPSVEGVEGDVDGNGVVDIKDATAIQRYLAEFEGSYAVGTKI